MKASRNILTDRERELVSLLMQDCESTGDIQTKLKRLFAGTIEQMLEAEMEDHLGYEKNSIDGNNSGNSRNGYNHKTIISDYGESEIVVPRDRNGEFKPRVLEKRQVRTDEIEQKILAMYSKGMSQRDIEDNLREIYGAEIPQTLISKITDKILPEVNEWQNRPLDTIYPIIYFDGIVFKSRKDAAIINKCVYSVLGIDMNGQKDILGLWISENEGASFYASICSDLKKRGVNDIFIACHDNLKGLSEAINAVFPDTKQQLCIVHQIRNSIRYVSYKDVKKVLSGLKPIYAAPSEEAALLALQEFDRLWGQKYPLVVQSWKRNWAEIATFFKYPPQIRKIVYTTNMIESYHRQLRKVTKGKSVFPTDESLLKMLYLVTQDILLKWTGRVHNWGQILLQLSVFFPDRVKSHLA